MIETREQFGKLITKLNLKVGVELGVARGLFSYSLLENSNLDILYSIDRWNDERHGINEMFETIKILSEFDNRSQIIRCEFSEALTFFENESLDFIYIDGYAHLGQESGKTLFDWYPKLKRGGIFAGHDYHEAWKPTIHVVDRFINTLNTKKLHVTLFDRYPSWYILK